MVETPDPGADGAREPDDHRPPPSLLLDVLGEVDRLAAEVGRLTAELSLADRAARAPAGADSEQSAAEVLAAASAAVHVDGDGAVSEVAVAVARARAMVAEATAGSAAAAERDAVRREDLARWAAQDTAEAEAASDDALQRGVS